MTSPVTCEIADGIATITMDDGKANVMSLEMIGALNAALDEADAAGAVVLLRGRPKMFSGGYDRAIFTQGADVIVDTVKAGGELVERLLSFPHPVVAACTGHAVAQGAFVLMSADTSIGVRGSFKIGCNEVAIGLTIPWYGIEAARNRLAPAWFNHATITGQMYSPDEALVAGFVHQLVEPDELDEVARAEAQRLASLDRNAHTGTKLRSRADLLERIHRGIDDDFAAATASG